MTTHLPNAGSWRECRGSSEMRIIKKVSRVKEDAVRWRTLSDQWPWVPSLGKNWRFSSPMVTSPFEWKILDGEETTQTNKLTNKQTFFFSQAANHPFSYRYGQVWQGLNSVVFQELIPCTRALFTVGVHCTYYILKKLLQFMAICRLVD